MERWFNARIETLVCLPWDAATALEWAALLARLRRKGTVMAMRDSMIAASAARHRLAVATTNVADFKKAGVAVVNPFG